MIEKSMNSEFFKKRLIEEVKEIETQAEYDYFIDLVEKKIKLEPINTLETASNTVDTTPPQMPDGFYAELIREEP